VVLEIERRRRAEGWSLRGGGRSGVLVSMERVDFVGEDTEMMITCGLPVVKETMRAVSSWDVRLPREDGGLASTPSSGADSKSTRESVSS